MVPCCLLDDTSSEKKMQSLSRTIKLPPTVIRKLRTCEDARAQAQDYQQRYLATACRYAATKVQDEFAAVQNSALYNRRVARAMQLLAQWLVHTDTQTALERLQGTTWRAMYQELGMAPDASELQKVSIQTSHGVTHTYYYDHAMLEPELVPAWAVALIAELVHAKWEGELAETLLQLHQRLVAADLDGRN